MKYKLIVIDLDDTLLNNQWVITEKNKVAIRRAFERGIKIVLASGRMPQAMRRCISDLPFIDVLISYNGAMIQDVNGLTLYQLPFAEKSAYELFQFLQESGYSCMHFVEDELYTNADDKIVDMYIQRTGAIVKKFNSERQLAKRGILKSIAYDPDIEGDGETLFFQRAFFLNGRGLKVLKTGCDFIEFNNAAVSKYHALEFLLATIQLSKEEVMAIGDGHNDLELIQHVGLGVAVANAIDEVKQVAALTVNSNDDDGVEQAIDYLLEQV